MRAFPQEMTILLWMYGGYVLKSLGEAVSAFFVMDTKNTKYFNNKNKLNIVVIGITFLILFSSVM
jgi:hypothetical protein